MKCQICFNNFDHSDHKPYVLIPCTHTLCIRCLDDLVDEPRQCPICSFQVKDRNPNWALLDLIPENNIDQLKYSLQKSLNETDELRKKLNEINRKQFKDIVFNLKEVRENINENSEELINLINEYKSKLFIETKNIETNFEIDRLNQIKFDHILDLKIKETRRRLAKNELNEMQINALRTYFSKTNSELNSRLGDTQEIKNQFEFIPNKNFFLQNDSMGRLKNVYSEYNHEKLVHNKAVKLIEEKKYELALDLVNRSIEMNSSSSNYNITDSSACALCYNYKGLALHGLSDFIEAINCFNRSIELDENNSEVFNNKANALRELKDFNGAIRYYSLGINKSSTLKQK